MTWLVYMLVCSDNTLYVGMTNDLDKRLATHNAGKGARYTRGRLPVTILAFWQVDTRSAALKLEATIKRMSRKQKLEMAND